MGKIDRVATKVEDDGSEAMRAKRTRRPDGEKLNTSSWAGELRDVTWSDSSEVRARARGRFRGYCICYLYSAYTRTDL